jgi:hypothetical protein
MTFIFVFIGIIFSLIAFCLVDLYLFSQNEKAYAKAYQKRIDDIKIGDVYEWNIDRDPPQRNPFKEPDENTLVIVISDKKTNQFGEVWVQYYFKNNGPNNLKWEKSAADLIKYFRKRKGE